MPGRRRQRKKGPRKANANMRLAVHGLVKVLAKPQRLRILAILSERAASPEEISERTDENIALVSYHLKVLGDHGLIAPDAAEPRRGTTEQLYRRSRGRTVLDRLGVEEIGRLAAEFLAGLSAAQADAEASKRLSAAEEASTAPQR
jgi:DNA-binding transcriptional ArsR family regulator